jgi:hypothetical protein
MMRYVKAEFSAGRYEHSDGAVMIGPNSTVVERNFIGSYVWLTLMAAWASPHDIISFSVCHHPSHHATTWRTAGVSRLVQVGDVAPIGGLHSSYLRSLLRGQP